MYKSDLHLSPGDWCFIRADSYDEEGSPDMQTHGVAFEEATHVLFCNPHGNYHEVPIRGKGRQRNGKTWILTGDADAPTLHPSIKSSYWHGWFENGEMRDA